MTNQPQELYPRSLLGIILQLDDDPIRNDSTLGCCERSGMYRTRAISTPHDYPFGVGISRLLHSNLGEQTQHLLDGYAGVARMDLVMHCVPVEPVTNPIQQPHWRRGPEMNNEVEEQVLNQLRL